MRTEKELSGKREKEPKKRSPFWEVMGGEFLANPKVMQWYPLIIIFFIFAIIVVQNESIVASKNEKINELDVKYKNVKEELGSHNEFAIREIPFEIMNLIEEQGFEKKDSAVFKVVIPAKKNKK